MATKKQATNKLAKPVKPAKGTNKNIIAAAKKEKQKQRGRPTKYKKEFAEQAYRYCLLGATDKQLAEFFSVNEDTVYSWKKNHIEFSESIKRGKEIADINVAESLFERALGITKTVSKPIKVKLTEYKDGKKISEVEKIEPAFEELYYPPDITAMIFWLKNRQPEKWRDKQEVKLEVTEVISDRLKKARSKNANQ